jgi:hypothetical protein
MSEENAVAVIETDEGVSAAIAQLKSGNTSFYSSIKGDGYETRNTVLKAVMSSKPIADNLGKVIKLQNVIVQQVEMVDEKTGVLKGQPRVILIDDKGEAFHAISGVLFRDIQTTLGILGEPDTWPVPLPLKVVQEGTGTRKFFTVALA